ncbi:MAG: hypothetical protein ABSE82_13145, partial [Nitrososphaerales archaeon]
MPNTKDRLDDHDDRLGRVEAALRLKPEESKKTFRTTFKEKYEWVINHKGTSGLLAIALFVSTYWLNHRSEWWNHDVDERTRTVMNEKGGISETLHNVQETVNRTQAKLETLEPFIHDVIQHQFDTAAKLPREALQARLPAIQRLTAVAKDQGVRANVPALDALGRTLSTVDNKTEGFWPTAAEFINYRSESINDDVKSLLRNDLPSCADHDP